MKSPGSSNILTAKNSPRGDISIDVTACQQMAARDSTMQYIQESFKKTAKVRVFTQLCRYAAITYLMLEKGIGFREVCCELVSDDTVILRIAIHRSKGIKLYNLKSKFFIP